MASEVEKPHAICIPFPAQGHVNPMLKLTKILHSKGVHITFVNNEYNQNRLLRALGPSGLEGLLSFQFKAIPDGLPLTEGDTQQDVAEEFGIPEALLWTSSVCGLLGYTQYERLVDMGIVPFKDANFQTNGDLDVVIDWIQGMENIRLRDMPNFIQTTNPDDIILDYVIRLTHQFKRASAIIFNSYESLDHDVLKSLKPNFPPTYALGPLQFILDPIEENNPETKCLTTNLWIDDPRCLDWLDSFDPDSVVYVNFGSITVMTNDQLVEFAWGLANSNKPFLWITRPDIISGDSFVLPPEFLEVAEKRGLIVSWCNQEKVLAHPAVGGFLTHGSWNSTLESISNGVPMICWPFFVDQQTNCWYCCNKWGIGMEIDTNVKRCVVEKQVRELMDGDKGKEMKSKVDELSVSAREATTSPFGSSYVNIENVAKVLLGGVNFTKPVVVT